MRNRIWLLLAFATVLGCVSGMIATEKRKMKYAVEPGGFCPACGNPVFDKRRRCGSCGERLIWRKEQ